MTTCTTSNIVTPNAALGSTWPKLSLRERAELIRDVVENQGHSRRAAATLLGISEKLVRDLLDLSALPSCKWADYRHGKIGRKKLVKAARAHKKRQAKLREVQQQGEHDQHVARAARAIEGFVRREVKPDSLVTGFFQELEHGPVTRQIFDQECPTTDQLQPLSSAKQVIAQSRPTLPPDPEAWEIANAALQWFAKWSQRVIPDANVRREAIAEARRKLAPGV